MSQIERVPLVYRVTIRVCEECIRGYGDVCYVPECAFWMKAVPEGGLTVDDSEEMAP